VDWLFDLGKLCKTSPLAREVQCWSQARIRAKVEHPFRVIKRQFGYVKVKYRGLAKNTANLMTLFALYNIWVVRKRLLNMGTQAWVRPKTARKPWTGAQTLRNPPQTPKNLAIWKINR
jgi:hypothetical protein